MNKKYVLVDGYYVELEEFKNTPVDIKEPAIVDMGDTVEGKTKQHLHEMRFQDMRRFCKDEDIPYSNRDKKTDLLRKIKLYYEERNL